VNGASRDGNPHVISWCSGPDRFDKSGTACENNVRGTRSGRFSVSRLRLMSGRGSHATTTTPPRLRPSDRATACPSSPWPRLRAVVEGYRRNLGRELRRVCDRRCLVDCLL
jgi:hypothetical protein